MVHRFPNRAVCLPDGLHWNVAGLLQEIIDGLRGAGRVDGVGVDAWGVDYGLLDHGGRLLGLPYRRRDSRTADMAARAFQRVSRDAPYAPTGIQTMAISTRPSSSWPTRARPRWTPRRGCCSSRACWPSG